MSVLPLVPRLLAALLVIAATLSWPGHARAREVVDGCGRTVTVPDTLRRVVTAGGTPSLNAFLCALGKGDTIVNGLPQGLRSPQWRFQEFFVPQVAGAPVVTGMGPAWTPDLEALAALPHDLVLVDSPQNAEQLAARGVTAYCLSWRDPTSVATAIDLLGDLLDVRSRAGELKATFTANQERVRRATADIPPNERRKAIYVRMTNLMIPMVATARFLIEQAGGVYAAPADLPVEHPAISLEQLLAWNPDVLLVFNAKEVREVLADPRLSGLSAVRRKAVYAVPFGMHGFTHFTPEQALALLWMGKTLYPERFVDLDLVRETQTFYGSFFGREPSESQAREILRLP